jgi:RimJ/RimL family protein N-acetyltransferase
MTEVQLRYFIDCDASTQARVRGWTTTEDFIRWMGRDFAIVPLDLPPGIPTGSGRMHNWVIYAQDQPVGFISGTIRDAFHEDSTFEAEPGYRPDNGPHIGLVSYMDVPHRGNGYAGASKRAIVHHPATADVKYFRVGINYDNEASLRAIAKTDFEYIGKDKKMRRFRLSR